LSRLAFSNLRRREIIGELADQTFDLLVIGGGITGAGIALDAQSRGLNVCLVDMQDFAAGTSSRSTKLVHGGLRYLKQLEVGLVAEVGKERAIVYENGPHVTTPERMLLPIYKDGTFGRFSTSLGLYVYDLLAGVKREERRRMLSREETLAREPLLKKDGLLGSGCYVEYRTDDARLTLEVLKKAVSLGAKAVNYMKADKFLYSGGKAAGVEATDLVTGSRHTIFAKKIINAAGPWVDDLRELDRSRNGKTLHLTKGVHIVFDHRRFPLRQAVYFDVPDGRMVFAIPRDGKTYVGTTDTNYSNRMNMADPEMTKADRDYLLMAVNGMFPDLRLTEQDVESSWVGLRPLIHQEGKSPSEISRRDEIFVSPSGLISMAGGKLTGYRKMAETAVDLVVKQLERENGGSLGGIRPCSTKTLPISGGDVGGGEAYHSFVKKKTEEGVRLGLDSRSAELLARRYGSNVDRLFAGIGRYAEQGADSGLPCEWWLMLMYAIEEEMALTPADFFVRRTGALFFDIASVRKYKEPVLRVMREKLSWTDKQAAEYAEELDRQLRQAVEPVC